MLTLKMQKGQENRKRKDATRLWEPCSMHDDMQTYADAEEDASFILEGHFFSTPNALFFLFSVLNA